MAQRPEPGRRMALEEYLVWEEQSPIRHEYVGGEAYAMSGASARHNLITLNIVRALHDASRVRGCRVFATDVKLRVSADRIYYPDVVTACGTAAEIEQIVQEPSLIAEVTSPSTRATDRREKLQAYLKVASLRTYLIVAQRHRHVIAYTRDAADEWRREEFHGDGAVPIPFLETHLTLEQIYDHVPLPPLTVKEGDEWEQWEDRVEKEELPA